MDGIVQVVLVQVMLLPSVVMVAVMEMRHMKLVLKIVKMLLVNVKMDI